MESNRSAVIEKSGYAAGFTASAYLIGIALGGFFDGILLHQVLQWHHLLSLVDSPAIQDIRVQILADGLFHVLMYVIAVVGLIILWKSRNALSQPGAGRWLLGTILIGFGWWNVADVGIFHWLLRIHRIRVDVDNPLVWDLGWLVVFGLIFIAIGYMVRARRARGESGMPPRTNRGTSIASLVGGVVIVAAAIASMPPSDSSTTMVMFHSDATPVDVFTAFDAAGARILWADPGGSVWAVRLPESSSAIGLYRDGALLVSNSVFAVGCLAWLST